MLLNNLAAVLVSFPRGVNKLIVVSMDVLFCSLTAWLAFFLRFDKIIAVLEPAALVRQRLIYWHFYDY